jgi:hypothetical protein
VHAVLSLVVIVALQGATPETDSVASPRGPLTDAPFQSYEPQPFVSDSPAQRPRAIEHSDFYYARLTVHRYASYAIVPTFITEYALGQSLYNNPPGSSGTRTAHSIVAVGLVGLFGINTVTGVWNLWDSRHDAPGRARRYIHAALMLASDAGFVATEAVAPGRQQAVADPSRRRLHRTLALSSMGLALGGYGMMLIWKKP